MSEFGALKQIHAGVLNVGYAEVGPTDRPAVILLHGWPYDIHSYGDVAPLLATASRTCAAMARRAFFQVTPSGMANNRHSLSIPSR
jgi:pimeloyl-ACP methyl ester carboxylesterase